MPGIWHNTNYFEKMIDSPAETFGGSAARVFRKYFIQGSKRIQAEIDFIGYPVVVSTTNATNGLPVTYISRVTPHRYNPFQMLRVLRGNGPGFPPLPGPSPTSTTYALPPWMYCTAFPSTAIKSIGSMDPNYVELSQDDVGNGYNTEVTAQYQTLDYQICEDAATLGIQRYPPLNRFNGYPDEALMRRMVSRYFREGGRYTVLGLGFSCWAGGDFFPTTMSYPPLIKEGQAIWEPRIQMTYIWREVPLAAVPWSILQTYVGGVNQYGFDPEWFPTSGLSPQTVLFKTWEPSELVWTSDGQAAVNLKYQFVYNPNVDLGSVRASTMDPTARVTYGWNQFPYSSRGWNWQLTRLSTPFPIPGGEPFAGRLVGVDYRPVFYLAGKLLQAPNLPTAGQPYGNQPYKVVDLNNLFRPVQP